MAAFVAIVTNGLGIWESYSVSYMTGYTNTYTGYFLIFTFSALYAKVMDLSGSATSIAYKLIDWFGSKRVMLVCILITSVLTYGGVSLFVCIFAAGPIMFMLFKEANLPRHLTIACFGMGTCTYTMTTLPGTPQLTNIIPTQYLGTTMTAAPVLSIVISVVFFICTYAYCLREEKKARAAGEFWEFPAGVDASQYQIADRSLLPPAWKAFLPMVVLLLVIIVGGKQISNSALLTVGGMLVATVLCFLLNYDKLKTKKLIPMLNEGLVGGISAIGGLAAVIAFGSVVQSTQAYQQIVQWLMTLEMHPYIKGVLATGIISGITGSSSGGLRLTLTSLSPYFLASGCNLETLHRLMALAAGSLDTLPHSAGLFLVLSYLGLTHKTGYRHMFVITVLIPAVLTVVFVGIAIVAGI